MDKLEIGANAAISAASDMTRKATLNTTRKAASAASLDAVENATWDELYYSAFDAIRNATSVACTTRILIRKPQTS